MFAVLAQQPPRLARVVGAEEPALLGLDDREDAIRVRRRHRDADLAHELRQPFSETRPGVAAVGGLPDAAARAAAAHLPRQALMIPERRVQDARVRRVHRQVARAARCVHAMSTCVHVLPPSVRAEDAALRRALPAIALRGDVHEVGVRRVDAHRARSAASPRARGASTSCRRRWTCRRRRRTMTTARAPRARPSRRRPRSGPTRPPRSRRSIRCGRTCRRCCATRRRRSRSSTRRRRWSRRSRRTAGS